MSSPLENVSVYNPQQYNKLQRVGDPKQTALTNQNSIAEEIKSRLRSGNICYHSVQNLLSSRLLS